MTVEKHDLDLSYFIDVVQIGQNMFTPCLQLCSPSKILHHAALFSQYERNNVIIKTTVKDYFHTELSVKCDQKRLTQFLYRLQSFTGSRSDIMMQGCHTTSRQLKAIKPAFEKLIKTKVTFWKDYLVYIISDNRTTNLNDYEVNQLRPVFKQIQALLWICSREGGKHVLLAVEIEPEGDENEEDFLQMMKNCYEFENAN